MLGLFRKELDRRCYEVERGGHLICFAEDLNSTILLFEGGAYRIPNSLKRTLRDSDGGKLCPNSVGRLIREALPIVHSIESLEEQVSELIYKKFETAGLVSAGRASIEIDLNNELDKVRMQMTALETQAGRLYQRAVDELGVINIDVSGADSAVLEKAEEREKYLELLLDQFENAPAIEQKP